MEYKKIEKDYYNLHVIKTDKFKTVNITVNFKRKLKKNELTIRNFLNQMLLNSSKKYPTSRDIVIETEELYDLGVRINTVKSGNYSIMQISEVFLNEKYTEEGMHKKSIEFLMELLFNPNIEKNKFSDNYFEIIKESIREDITSIKENPRKYSLIRLYEEMGDGPHSYRSCGYLEDLDKITRENLYEYYKSVVENDTIDIFIIGDVDASEIEKILDEKIPKTIRIKDELSHYVTDNIRHSENEVKEKIETIQSNLSIGLKLNELTKFERDYVLNIYSFILGGSSDSKLFQNVREKEALCYTIGSTIQPVYSKLIITAGINGKDYEKTIELIKQQIDDMKSGNFTEEDVKKGIITYIIGCNQINDSPTSIINNYVSHEYLKTDLIEEKRKNIQKVTKESIVALAKKIDLDTIFLLEGKMDNE